MRRRDSAPRWAEVRPVRADTYLRLAEALNRRDLMTTQTHGVTGLVDDVHHGAVRGQVTGAVDAAAEKVGEWVSPDQ